jgi:hypothetical protein
MSEPAKTINEERWELPEPLQVALNPELLAKAEAKQEERRRRTASPYANLSPQEFEYARALRMVAELSLDLARTNQTIHRLVISDPDNRLEEYEAARDKQLGQLAEAYAITGRYDEALKYEPDPVLRAEYLATLTAIFREDDETCEHDAKFSFVEKEVWSIRHDRRMYLICCAAVLPEGGTCGFRNVTLLSDELSRQREHRARALQIAGGMKPADAKRALEAAGHTTRKLLN